jgi:hypothetical protein
MILLSYNNSDNESPVLSQAVAGEPVLPQVELPQAVAGEPVPFPQAVATELSSGLDDLSRSTVDHSSPRCRSEVVDSLHGSVMTNMGFWNSDDDSFDD